MTEYTNCNAINYNALTTEHFEVLYDYLKRKYCIGDMTYHKNLLDAVREELYASIDTYNGMKLRLERYCKVAKRYHISKDEFKSYMQEYFDEYREYKRVTNELIELFDEYEDLTDDEVRSERGKLLQKDVEEAYKNLQAENKTAHKIITKRFEEMIAEAREREQANSEQAKAEQVKA